MTKPVTKPLTILGISGSLRAHSYNHAALVAAQGLLPRGVTLTIFDLAGIPLFNQDEENHPSPRVVAFKKSIRAADAILISTPEYNYSVPGVLKNAMDCASRPYGDSAWAGKPIAIMGASVSTFGSARAQYHLRQTLVALDMLVLNQPEVMIANAGDVETTFNAQGQLINALSQNMIRQLLVDLAAWTRKLKPKQPRKTMQTLQTKQPHAARVSTPAHSA